MKKVIISLLVAIVLIPVTAGTRPINDDGPKIQIALLLDTSNSMDGLIDQARARLWEIVNEMALVRKRGVRPHLEVALYEYGKNTLPAAQGYLQQLTPFTTDLDLVSEALFGLRTSGGDEYCGMVIQVAEQALAWSGDNRDYKAIFIAGNESFAQGSVPFREACAAAIRRGIAVNTIFCGPQSRGILDLWKEGADLADGRYMSIDHNQALAHVNAPQDQRILALNKKLNDTFVAYGKKGKTAARRQKAEDKNAAAISEEVAVQRTLAKASYAPAASDWDAVSAIEGGDLADAELAEAEFDEAEPMAAMDLEQRKAYIGEKSRERKTIQDELAQLKQERSQWLAKQQKQAGTLSSALVKTVKDQLEKKSFEFVKETPGSGKN